MLPLLPEISLGFLTLWLLLREGMEAKIKKSTKNFLCLDEKIKVIDIIIKCAVVVVFSVGISFKISATSDAANFNKTLLQKLDTMEKKLESED